MIQLDFRENLRVLARWATSVKDYLEYQDRHGKPPPRLDELKAEVLQALGIKVSYLPNSSTALVSKRRRKIGGPVPVNLVFDIGGDPFNQLGSVVQSVLGFPKNRWPAGVEGSKEIIELWAMLRLIAEHGGRRLTIVELKRIVELVKSILSGKPIKEKETLGAGPEKPPAFSLWECPNGTIKVFSRLRPLLDAYLTGEKEHNLAGHDFPYQVSALLKKLIKSAQEFEYKPDPNRWPRSKRLASGVVMIFFDAKEYGLGWCRPASRLG